MIDLDWFYCTLLRSGNPLAAISDIKPRVPDKKFLIPDYFTRLLPIDKTPTRENLLHLIESKNNIINKQHDKRKSSII